MTDLENPYVIFVHEPLLTPPYEPVEKKMPGVCPDGPPTAFYSVTSPPPEEHLTYEVPTEPSLRTPRSEFCRKKALYDPYRIGCATTVLFCLLLAVSLVRVYRKPEPSPEDAGPYGKNPDCGPKTRLGWYQHVPPRTNHSVQCFHLLAQVYRNDCLWADNCQWYDRPSAVFMCNLTLGRLVDTVRDELPVVLGMVDPSYDYWITDGGRPACLNNGTVESECTGEKNILCISWSAYTGQRP